MNYLFFQLKVAAVIIAFYFVYRIFIGKSNLFRYKRLFILASLVLAYIAPFIKINIHQADLVNYYQKLPEVIIGAYTPKVAEANDFNYQYWLIAIISFISLNILILFIKQLIELFFLIKTSPKKAEKGFVLVETKGQNAFTFFRYIFMGKLIPENSRETILRHEKVHAGRLHSFDNMVIELVLVTQWFNPAVWLFRKALKENHEYEADTFLLKQGVSIDNYQQLLLNQMFQTQGIRFSSFNYNSFIKNRIKMMTKTNARAGKTRFFLATILSLFVVSVFSFKAETISQIKEEVKSLGVELTNAAAKDTIKNNKTDKDKKVVKDNKNDKLFLVPDQFAKFQGKDLAEFSDYVMKNMKYPTEAVQKKMQGKVYVQFVVEKDGTIKDAKVLRGVGEILDKEAIRAVKSSPAWTPAKHEGRNVRQMFTLPVLFRLQE